MTIGSDAGAAPSLWTPVTIGSLTLRHRLVMAAMGTGFPSPEGDVTDRLTRYLARRAEGGIALVTTEAAAVDPSGSPFPRALAIDDDRRIGGLRRLTAAVHAHDVPVAVQIYHAGRQMSRRVSSRQPVAPSAIPCPLVREMPRALETGEVPELAERFASAAERARMAGFDAVELHGAHGYLIHQFLTPLANRRTDEWGGDLRGRARFALEVVRRTRRRVGRDFPLLVKLSADDHLPGGLTIEDTLTVGRWLEESGVDALVVSAGTYGSFEWVVQPITQPAACLRRSASRFREALRIPVVTVGRINDPVLADEIVRSGDADLVQMGRALLADPDLPRNARDGRRPFRPCIACNECLAQLMRAEPIRCAVNPGMGHEPAERSVGPSPRRRVVVAGGGLAGMHAALSARERGHDVTLLERRDALGGRFRLADRPAYKREVRRLADYLARRLAETGVDVRLETEASTAELGRIAPDVVIVATGARRTRPLIDGASDPCVMTAEECLAAPPPAAGHAVVIGGSGTACEASACLRERGWDVTLLAPDREPAREAEIVTRRAMIGELGRLGVRAIAEARVETIHAGAVSWVDSAGRPAVERAALVVVTEGRVPDDDLARALGAGPWSVHSAGDCVEPGGVGDAFRSATEVVMRLERDEDPK